MKVLILDAAAASAVAAAQALGRNGVCVHAQSNKTVKETAVFYSRFVDKKIISPSFTSQESSLQWLRQLDSRESYDLIIPATERALQIIQLLSENDILRKKCVIASVADVDAALDKIKTWALAKQLDIPVPQAQCFEKNTAIDKIFSQDELSTFPVVLKSAQSQVVCEEGFKYAQVCIARNAAEKKSYLTRWLPYVDVQQQEYIAGHGLGVECLYKNGKKIWAFAHKRIHELPLTGGASTYRCSIDIPDAILECADKILSALNWHGVAMVEFRIKPDGEFVLLEINPRLWGSLTLAIAAGVNFPMGLLSLATDQTITEQVNYRRNLYMRNLVSDTIWMKENWSADHRDPLLLTRDHWESARQWLRVFSGDEQWDHCSWDDPRLMLNEFLRLGKVFFKAFLSRVIDYFELQRMSAQHFINLRRLAAERANIKTICFVCYGNICRSPFAEKIAKAQLKNINCSSSGIQAINGKSSPENIQSLANNFSVNLSDHRACRLTQLQIDAADMLIIMDPKNYRDILQRFPTVKAKLFFLGLFCEKKKLTVIDPVDLPDSGVKKTNSQIIDGINGLKRWLTIK